jgi:hypothetical protein
MGVSSPLTAVDANAAARKQATGERSLTRGLLEATLLSRPLR